MACSSSWHCLPTEMKLNIIDLLPQDDVKSFSNVDKRTYQACVPALFKNVSLNDFEAIDRFLDTVPRQYCSYIEQLDICTQHRMHCTPVLPRIRADAVIALLSASPRLTTLSLRVSGSLDKSVITPFPSLHNLKCLSIANCGDEIRAPLSERLVVSMAAHTPHLEELSLDRITRSKMHAPELEGAYPCPPLALNDADIPAHPLLSTELSLPSLLRIPTLRKLTIRDTHLGHDAWNSIPVACRLQFLDIGSCYHEDDGFNTRCTERIMAAVGPTVDEFSLTAAVSDDTRFAEPAHTPLVRLRKLHISPFFPVDSVVETMTNLAGSPVEKISVQCFGEDLVDVCSALEEFLSIRVERGPTRFYHKLQDIHLCVTNNNGADGADGEEDGCGVDEPTEKEMEERREASRRLQEFCRDLKLRSVVGQDVKKKSLGKPAAAGAGAAASTTTSFVDSKRYHVKGRSMTI